MTTKCWNCTLRRLDAFVDMSDEEVRFTERFKTSEIVVEPRTTLLREGATSPQLYTVLNGLGLRYKMLPDGRRQVLSFLFPGDFVGLQAGVMGAMGHSVQASSRMTLCVFDRTRIWSVFQNRPDRAFDITWLAASDDGVLGEALTSVGQRTALESAAWLLVHLRRRAEALDLVDGDAMEVPWRQNDLADAMGLSLVHTNKTLARLRQMGLATWGDGRIVIPDMVALAVIAKVGPDLPEPRPLI